MNRGHQTKKVVTSSYAREYGRRLLSWTRPWHGPKIQVMSLHLHLALASHLTGSLICPVAHPLQSFIACYLDAGTEF